MREDGNEFPICDMSEPEAAAIGECVIDQIPGMLQFGKGYYIEADTCLGLDETIEEEMPSYGLLRCLSTSNGTPHEFPSEVINALAGKFFRVSPKQYGMNPWGKKVFILFESVPKTEPCLVKPETKGPVVLYKASGEIVDYPGIQPRVHTEDLNRTLINLLIQKGAEVAATSMPPTTTESVPAAANQTKAGIKASQLIALALQK